MSDEKPTNFSPASPDPAKRDAARKRAQNHFLVAEQRDSEVRKEILREQNATAAKTAKLRALRLEKEAAERLAKASAPAPRAKQPKPRKIKVV
jgi:hypothetical protein